MKAAATRYQALVVASLALLICGCRSRPSEISATQVRDLPEEVARHIPDYRPLDTRPYEFIWARRIPQQDHWLDFERLLGWRIETSDRAAATLDRCRNHQLWGEFVGLVSYSSEAPGGWVRLIPPQPLQVADPIDTLTIWIHSSGSADAAIDTAQFTCIVRDVDGVEHAVNLGPLLGHGWRLLYARLADALRNIANYPLEVVAFEWAGLPVVQGAELRLDALSLFIDASDPIRYEPRPRRPLAMAEGQLEGINRAEGLLPFPVPIATILPAPSRPDSQAEVHVQQVGRGPFIIADASNSEPVGYRIWVAGGVEKIDVLWDGEPTGIVVAGIHLTGDTVATSEPTVIRQERQRVYIEYQNGKIARISANGSSLIVDIDYRGRGAEEIWAGPLTLSRQFVPLQIPYLHQPDDAVPPVLLATESNPPLFVHMIMDPYRSNASKLAIDKQGEEVYDTWRLGAIYLPRTDQLRNHLHERFVLSVSSRLLDVLPVIPADSGARATALVDRFVSERVGGSEAGKGMAPLVSEPAVGLEFNHTLVLKPDEFWRSGMESRAFRLRANPHVGGTPLIRDWFARLASAGAMPALYLNIRELSPLNQFWSPDHVLRESDSRWRSVDGFAFAAKPLFALQWLEEHQELIQEEFQPGAYWLGAFSSDPPWLHTDYDRRVPGAATLSQSLFADGDLLVSLSAATEMPLIGYSGGARFYAGLLDGLVTEQERDTSRPYDPIYKLHRIQPLSVVFAPPFPDGLFDIAVDDPAVALRVHERLDRYLADQIAYGNAGRLPHPQQGVATEFRDRILYSLLALQQRTLLREPERILYGAEDGYVPLATAIQKGIWHRSFLYLQYSDHLEIWVNGSQDQTWTVRVGRETYDLPPSGWLAASESLFAFSGTVDGNRIDYVESPEYLYLHPRGKAIRFRKLESTDGRPRIVIKAESHTRFSR